MLLQDRRRHLWRHIAFHRVANCLGFALVGHGADDGRAVHDLPHAHRDRLARDIVQRRKPTFAQLLPAARFIELDENVRLVCLKIGRRVVEGQVAVLADADERHVDRMVANDFAHAAALSLRILLGIKIVERTQGQR